MISRRTVKKLISLMLAVILTVIPAAVKAEDAAQSGKPTQLSELEAVIAKYQGVSVYYKDITSGEEYFYNPDVNYFIVSLIKAPYIVYVYRCLLASDDRGAAALEKKYTYIESDYRAGTGKIKNMSYGTEFTLAELISYAIRWSDNIAMDKIRAIFPVSGFKDFAAGINLPHPADIRSAVNGAICARCAAVYLKAVYDFIEEGNIYSAVLKEHMMNTGNKMIYADYPIARKYGWADKSFHDMGIVYNEKRPYLIAILSDNDYGNFAMFKDISLAVQKYNDSKIPKVPKVGDVLGDVLYSDITVYINGQAIPASIIQNKTLVVVEDLAKYGFDVKWDGAERTLKVEPNKEKIFEPVQVTKDTNNKPGAFKQKYFYTDIKTYISGELVESFAIDGRTLIDFELLKKYGALTWDGDLRELRLTIK